MASFGITLKQVVAQSGSGAIGRIDDKQKYDKTPLTAHGFKERRPTKPPSVGGLPIVALQPLRCPPAMAS